MENQYTACKFAAINSTVSDDGNVYVRACIHTDITHIIICFVVPPLSPPPPLIPDTYLYIKNTHTRSVNMRLFNKVPNTYHTGKDDDRRAGAFYTYHGDRVRKDACMHALHAKPFIIKYTCAPA